VQRAFLSGRGDQHAFGHGLVVVGAEAVAAHVGEVGVAQDHECPCAHRGARFEPFLRGPGLEQGFLHEVVGQVGATAQTAGKGAQVRDHAGQFALEGDGIVRAAGRAGRGGG
jgi:hypothetical protein